MIGAIRPYSFSVQSLCNPFVFVQIWRQSALLRGRRLAASCPVSCGPYVPPCAGDATPAANALNGGLVAPADYFELRAVNAAKQAAAHACHDLGTAPQPRRLWPFRWPVELPARATPDDGKHENSAVNIRLDLMI